MGMRSGWNHHKLVLTQDAGRDNFAISNYKTVCMMDKIRIRVAVLWITVILGFTLHSLADMMPMFWGADIAMDSSGTAPAGMLLFMTAVSYLIPVIALLCVMYARKRGWLMVNFILAMLIMLFNIFHSSELFMDFHLSQLAVLPVMDVLGVLLAVESNRLRKEGLQEEK